MHTRWIFLAAIIASPLPAAAQVCRGGVNFSDTKLLGQAVVEHENSSTVIGASGGMGGEKYYGLATLGVRTYSNRDGSTFLFAFGGGRNFQWKQTGAMRHCVELSGEFGTGPDNIGPQRADQSSTAGALSLMSSLPLRTGSSLKLAPFAGLSVVYSSVVTRFSDESTSSVEDFYELVSLGIGLSSNQVALHPYVQFPLGRVSTDPILGMRFSLKIGRKE